MSDSFRSCRRSFESCLNSFRSCESLYDSATSSAPQPMQLQEIPPQSPEFNEVAEYVRSHRNPFVTLYPRWYDTLSTRNINLGHVTVRGVRKFVPSSRCVPNAMFHSAIDIRASAVTMKLIHGTRRTAEDIASDPQAGLDPRFAANDLISRCFDKFYGHGLYMADALDYSHKFARPMTGNGKSGTSRVIICEAIIGRCMDYGSQKKRDLVRPPEIPGAIPPASYDSVCGEIPGGSTMYVVYDISRVRPLYEVEYEFRAHSCYFKTVSTSLQRRTGLSRGMLLPLLGHNSICDAIAASKVLGKSADILLAAALSGSLFDHLWQHPNLALATEVLVKALRHSGKVLRCAPPDIQTDEGVVRAAVEADGLALEHVSQHFGNHRGIVGAAVSRFGMALQFASAELRDDYSVVLAAVQSCACALQFASAELRARRDLVMAAVERNGFALQYASEELKGDVLIVAAALAQNAVAAELRDNSELRARFNLNDDVRREAVASLGARGRLCACCP